MEPLSGGGGKGGSSWSNFLFLVGVSPSGGEGIDEIDLSALWFQINKREYCTLTEGYNDCTLIPHRLRQVYAAQIHFRVPEGAYDYDLLP